MRGQQLAGLDRHDAGIPAQTAGRRRSVVEVLSRRLEIRRRSLLLLQYYLGTPARLFEAIRRARREEPLLHLIPPCSSAPVWIMALTPALTLTFSPRSSPIIK